MALALYCSQWGVVAKHAKLHVGLQPGAVSQRRAVCSDEQSAQHMRTSLTALVQYKRTLLGSCNHGYST